MYILNCLRRGKTRVTQSSLVLFCIWLVEKVVQISKAITACSSSRLMQQNGPFTNMAFLRNFSCALPLSPYPQLSACFFNNFSALFSICLFAGPLQMLTSNKPWICSLGYFHRDRKNTKFGNCLVIIICTTTQHGTWERPRTEKGDRA